MKNLLVLTTAVVFLGGCGLSQNETENSPHRTMKSANQDSSREERVEEKPIAEEQPSRETAAEEEAAANPKFRMKDDFSLESIENPAEKAVLLTIDDAPDKNALAMAQTLQNLNARAIFFVNGHFIDRPEEAEVLKKIHDMGFSIGNHTYHHKGLMDLPEEEQRKEIVELNNRIEEITGERPKFFRAPFGVNTSYSKQIAAEEKMLVMNWTYGYDWEREYQSREALADIMINTPLLRNGANLLLHDRKWTSEALGDIVKGLKGKGYTVVDPKLIETP